MDSTYGTDFVPTRDSGTAGGCLYSFKWTSEAAEFEPTEFSKGGLGRFTIQICGEITHVRSTEEEGAHSMSFRISCPLLAACSRRKEFRGSMDFLKDFLVKDTASAPGLVICSWFGSELPESMAEIVDGCVYAHLVNWNEEQLGSNIAVGQLVNFLVYFNRHDKEQNGVMTHNYSMIVGEYDILWEEASCDLGVDCDQCSS
ncbi:hypothetical protein C8J57DRAFT_1543237 [Mycena rebaudengoi]|nr:hypothetical protein C8J57DRAFT_1543237 [Mycena rebaudengoi]